jgi:hypothetical protein
MLVFRILPPIAFTLEKLFAKNLPKIRASRFKRKEHAPALFLISSAKDSNAQPSGCACPRVTLACLCIGMQLETQGQRACEPRAL